jgi:ketosteroid isomerase-like protein
MFLRRPLSTLAAAAAVTLTCLSCADRGSQAAHDEIVAASSRFAEALSRGDTLAVARSYTADAEWYPPEAPVVKGAVQIARAWQSSVGVARRHRVDVAEVVETRDRAEEIGRFAVSTDDGSVVAAAKYLVIWVRDSDGEWKRQRDFFNWDIPPKSP